MSVLERRPRRGAHSLAEALLRAARRAGPELAAAALTSSARDVLGAYLGAQLVEALLEDRTCRLVMADAVAASSVRRNEQEVAGRLAARWGRPVGRLVIEWRDDRRRPGSLPAPAAPRAVRAASRRDPGPLTQAALREIRDPELRDVVRRVVELSRVPEDGAAPR